jgi:hypothetical protein
MLNKQISLVTVFILLVAAITVTAVSVWAITALKTIHGTALVIYSNDITVTDFKFVGANIVSITMSTSASPTPACTIRVSGAGISGSLAVPLGWSSPYTSDMPITGTLTTGTIVIEVM